MSVIGFSESEMGSRNLHFLKSSSDELNLRHSTDFFTCVPEVGVSSLLSHYQE